MLFHILAVRDRAADVFGSPMFVPSIGIAVRGFGDEVKRESPDNQINKHPEDFDLYSLGSFDDATGEFTTHAPKMVAIGKDYVRVTN